VNTPWAVLLCKFSDDDSEPYDRSRYEQLFTTAGNGKLNMVTFFHEMSHGRLDLSGSRVFGWYTLDKTRNEYVGSGVNQQGRTDLVTWARQAALNDGVKIDDYFSVVVCMNVSTDLFGGPYGVVCDDGRWGNGMSGMSPSLLGQEMGHAYGLNHSMADGSIAEYNDPWDVMSTAMWPTMGPHPDFDELDMLARPVFLVGPGINAANMWGQGWLDAARVWNAGDHQHNSTVQLRPLHRHDLSGYLAARIGQYLVEFRMPERWDSGLHAPMVLIHTFWNGRSYVHQYEDDQMAMAAGDRFKEGDSGDPLGAFLSIEVASINEEQRIATLRVSRKPNRHPNAGPGITFGGVDRGGGGFIIVGGKVVWVPPRSPILQILEKAIQFEESDAVTNGPIRDTMKQDALEAIQTWSSRQLQQNRSYQGPAPPSMELREGELTTFTPLAPGRDTKTEEQ
jgi:hypothetical protein